MACKILAFDFATNADYDFLRKSCQSERPDSYRDRGQLFYLH